MNAWALLFGILTALFLNSAWAAKTDCSNELLTDPIFAKVPAHLLRQSIIQNFAMLRIDHRKRSLILVGRNASDQASLIEAIVNKASQANIPSFIFRSEGVRLKVAGVTTLRHVTPSALLNSIPKGSLVIVDFDDAEYLLTKDKQKTNLFQSGNIDWDHVMKTLEFLIEVQKKDGSRAIIRMNDLIFFQLRLFVNQDQILDRFLAISTEPDRLR